MRALQLQLDQLVLREDYRDPVADDGSVRVRVLQAGICETDLQLVAGYMGFAGVLGHEFVGIAESGSLAGKRVVGEINCTCNDCDWCAGGLGNHCPQRTVIGILNHDGAFADYVVVPETNLHHVPDSMPDDMAVIVEPVAAALQITEQIGLHAGMRAAVVGDGRLAFLCAQVLGVASCKITVVGKHTAKLVSFRSIGLETCLLGDAPQDRAFDVVVECSGSSTGLATALSLVRPRGTIVLKTTVASDHLVSLAPVVIDEITIVGSRCGPFDKAISAIMKGQFQLDGFISGRYPLPHYREAFDHAVRKDAMKVILEIAE